MRSLGMAHTLTTGNVSTSAMVPGQLYVFADTDTHFETKPGVPVIRRPEHDRALNPLLHGVPLQLLAHHTACARGTDVERPRNLAKSVTVG